jgi:hypothetical protein
MRHNVLRDDIAAALVRSGTAVLASVDFPRETRIFVRHNYVPWGRLWVVGQPVPAVAVRGFAVPFRVGVPSTYIVVDRAGAIDAAIDGVPVRNGIELSRGWHRLTVRSRPSLRPLVIWAGTKRSPNFLAYIRETEDYLQSRRKIRRVAVGAGHARQPAD